jgi:hypothetical protein
VVSLLEAVPSLKHRTIVMASYGAGLRIGEACALHQCCLSDQPGKCCTQHRTSALDRPWWGLGERVSSAKGDGCGSRQPRAMAGPSVGPTDRRGDGPWPSRLLQAAVAAVLQGRSFLHPKPEPEPIPPGG